MKKDPIVEEIHKIRETLAKESGFNLHKLFKKLKEMEKQEDQTRFVQLEKLSTVEK